MLTLSKMHTLIIDDFTEFARSVKGMLHTLGNEFIDIVSNADDAIRACEKKNYDIILSDYNLGEGKDGQQLLEELIILNLLDENHIFILLTAENTSLMVMGAIEYSPDDYIIKPFTTELLKSRLIKMIKKKHCLRSLNRYLKKQQWDKAIQECYSIRKTHPLYSISTLYSEFIALKKQKKWTKALDFLFALNNEREMAWISHGIGEIYYHQNDCLNASHMFEKVTINHPMYLDSFDWLAKCQLKLGQPDEAQQTLNEAVKKSPKVLNRQKQLGLLAKENHDFKTMRQAFRQAIHYGKHSSFSSPDEYIQLNIALKREWSNENNNIASKKILKESESVFEALNKKFKNDTLGQLRGHIAQATFYKMNNNKSTLNKHIEKAKALYNSLSHDFSQAVSLEICSHLKEVDEHDFSKEVIDNALIHHIDDSAFIKKASAYTDNDALIEKCNQTAHFHKKGIEAFKNKNYQQSIALFKKALELTPENINMLLNYVQSLLKCFQSNRKESEHIVLAKQLLTKIHVSKKDHRYLRYTELKRLTQLILKNKGIFNTIISPIK
jgi:CheY-like chemotaxis protein